MRTVHENSDESYPITIEKFKILFPNAPIEKINKFTSSDNKPIHFYDSFIFFSANNKLKYFHSTEHTNDPDILNAKKSYIYDKALDPNSSITNNGHPYQELEKKKIDKKDFIYVSKGNISWKKESNYLSYYNGSSHLLVKYKDKKDKPMEDRKFESTVLTKEGERSYTNSIDFSVPHKHIYSKPEYYYKDGVEKVKKVVHFFIQIKDKEFNQNYDETSFRCIIIDEVGDIVFDKYFNSIDRIQKITDILFIEGGGIVFSGYAKEISFYGLIEGEKSQIINYDTESYNAFERIVDYAKVGDIDYLIASNMKLENQIGTPNPPIEIPASKFYIYKIVAGDIESRDELDISYNPPLGSRFKFFVQNENYALASLRILETTINGFAGPMQSIKFYSFDKNSFKQFDEENIRVIDSKHISYQPFIYSKGDSHFVLLKSFYKENGMQYITKYLTEIKM